MPKFDYEGAKKAGYTDDQIADYLAQSRPNFDVKGAIKAGHSLSDVNEHLNGLSLEKPKKEERSNIAKAGRVGSQLALGMVEGSPLGLAYDIAVGPASKALNPLLRSENAGADIEFLYEKNAGKPFEEWSKADQDFYTNAAVELKPGTKLDEDVHPDISIRGLAEKVTGVDLKPEGSLEKAAWFTGLIRDPKKIFELGKTGLNPKDIAKAIAPSGREVLRGAGAGIALQMAEEGELGPLGSLAAAVVGDISGNLATSAVKGAAKIIANPKVALAEVASKFTPSNKRAIQQGIIDDFRQAGVTADIGTITNSPLMKMIQSRLAQSGLTGGDLDILRKKITNEILEEYKSVADTLGQSKFSTLHDAGEFTKDYMKKLRDADLKETRDYYKQAENDIKKDAFVDVKGIANKVEELEKSLSPGNIKSAEQSSVLDLLGKMKRDLFDSEGHLLKGKVKDLMNDKIALNDIINYEVLGGSKQLLKSLVNEIDRAIVSYGKSNPSFAKNYILANKRFSKHAKTFRNKRISKLLGDGDPAEIMKRMESVQGIRELNDVLSKTKDGTQLMGNLKRMKLDEMIGKNMVDSTTNHLKLGTFSKLLEKGKNRDIARELMPKSSYDRLVRLQKNAGQLAESAEKFLNSSKSGITVADVAIVGSAMKAIGAIFSGNIFPLLTTVGGLTGARYLTKLLANPEFLKLVEDFMLASQKNQTKETVKIARNLAAYIRAAQDEEK